MPRRPDTPGLRGASQPQRSPMTLIYPVTNVAGPMALATNFLPFSNFHIRPWRIPLSLPPGHLESFHNSHPPNHQPPYPPRYQPSLRSTSATDQGPPLNNSIAHAHTHNTHTTTYLHKMRLSTTLAWACAITDATAKAVVAPRADAVAWQPVESQHEQRDTSDNPNELWKRRGGGGGGGGRGGGSSGSSSSGSSSSGSSSSGSSSSGGSSSGG